ncbi:hypothetical protein FRC09_007737 [Ceratobasidium sp. 395]|nr:hypothetical protein FRC09_007737 [Ceratobasidium sp. 395]
MAGKTKRGIDRIKKLFRSSPRNSEPLGLPTQSESTPHAASYNHSISPPPSRSPSPVVAEKTAKCEPWAQLSTLVHILDTVSNSFGPVKEAVGEILKVIDSFEAAAQNREDYQILRDDLNAVFHDLAESFGASTPLVMTPSIVSLARGIKRELDIIRQKQGESGIGTYMNARTDADRIVEHYRRIQTLLQRITENQLRSLPNSEAAKYNSAESSSLRDRCTKDTRLDVLNDLYRWAGDDRSQKIYWLNGMAGTGKTTIAYSLCERLESSRQLAASFFCSRQLPECRSINRIIPTISYQLSHYSHPFRSAVSRVLQDIPGVHNQLLLHQLQNLIAEPLDKVKNSLPTNLVIVIDALDECDDNDGVGRMLDALLSHANILPIKFFVASRPDAKILDRMRGQPEASSPIELRLHELGRSTVQEDIKTYFTARLKLHMDLPAANLSALLERSGVLFIYASTVVRYLECDNFSRADDRLEEILKVSKDSSNDSEKGINDLYTAILETALNDPKITSRDRSEMKLVLDTVICAQEPLSIDAMAGLLGLNARKVQAALRPLFSVLHLSDMTTHTITTLHESFPDYLLDESRSGVFHCDANQHHTYLAQQCFKYIRLPNPPFNICNLESSYALDKDVPDLPARVESAISKQLAYACRYFVAHCMSAEASQDLVSMLRRFASERFLLCMEVMNLSGSIRGAVSTLEKVQELSSGKNYLDEDIKILLRDMWKFADSFASSGARLSTPHIYVSTLTFWPDHSPISSHYRSKHTRLITNKSTAMSLRNSTSVSIPDFEGSVLCVSYSPDGAYIVSGSSYSTIRKWDAHTGQLVGQPFVGHTSSVISVAYSPDSVYIASGSLDSTIRIWDAHTGQPVGHPLQEHTWSVTSVAYSPDSACVVSGSLDSTIRIWDAHTRQSIGQPLTGHNSSVLSVAYSPDGAYIISGSLDNTIRVWDARTRQSVGHPLVGHTRYVKSVAYSSDGAYIVSGSHDNTIRIWDARTGQPVGQPLEGHTLIVNCVAYSPDDAYIVSGSWDRTIRIWDAHTGQPVGQPLRGHAGFVNSVAYSLDGASILSGSDDKTIRVWDVRTALKLTDNVPEIDNGHSSLVHSLSANSETRVVCNLGCQIDCPHMAWTLNDDGWIVYNDDKLIWVPPDLREILVPPQNTALTSTRGFLQLDLDRGRLGEHWRECFQPGRLSNYD